jgi:hypothetical protein
MNLVDVSGNGSLSRRAGPRAIGPVSVRTAGEHSERQGVQGGPCAKVFDDTHGEDLLVQGYEVTDPDTGTQVGHLPTGERVVRIPRVLLVQAMIAMGRQP